MSGGTEKGTETPFNQGGQMVNLTLLRLEEDEKWKLREMAARWRLSESEMVTICIGEYHAWVVDLVPEAIEEEIAEMGKKYGGKGKVPRITVYPENPET